MIDRIYCKNFRSIGECDIELRDGLTTLIGKNGTGKSSIIESIIYALYSKTRDKTKKESIRRNGTPEDELTICVLDFTVRGIHYRLRRWLTPKMSTMASLYAFDDNEYVQLHEDSPEKFDKELGTEIATGAKGVNEAIVPIVGVDYDGFKASFVAQQKELDSFASLATEKRKEFFLNLLGYAALDDVKPELAAQVRQVKGMIEGLENQNLNVDQIQRDIATSEKQLADVEKSVEKGSSMVAKAKEDHEKAATDYSDTQLVAERVHTYEADIRARETEKQSIVSEVEILGARIKENSEKTKDFDPQASISDQLHAAQEKSRRAEAYRERLAEKQRAEQPMREKHEAITKDDKAISELEKKVAVKPDVDEPTQKLATLKSQRDVLRTKVKELGISKNRFETLIASAERGEVAKCPSCGSSVATAEGQAHLKGELAEIEAQIEALTQQGKAANVEIEKAEETLERAKLAVATYDNDVRNLNAMKSAKVAAQTAYDELCKQVKAQEEELAKLEGTKLTDKEKLALDEQIVKLTQLKEREDEMRTASIQLGKDQQALAMKTERMDAIAKELAEKNSFVKANKKKADSATRKGEKAVEAKAKYEKYQDALNARLQSKAALEAQLAAQKGNLKKAKEQSESLAGFKVELEDLICSQEVVEHLRKTLPARIAPRLADIAGHLLSIATNGKYSMMELDEKYEVSIYTDIDIRPLAMMSGGETDVIALALRIAVAKILLEASGMGSQTFILDEIFGALDDERRESTCQALMNIRAELPRILCITHIDEIKDMADYTYVVEADENGVSWVREMKIGARALMAEAQAAGNGEQDGEGNVEESDEEKQVEK